MIRRASAEFIGSALLAALVIGSGIAAQTLTPGDTGLQLLENAFATALKHARNFATNGAETLADYVTEESRDVVPKADLDAFHDDVDALRDDVERVAARVARLSWPEAAP